MCWVGRKQHKRNFILLTSSYHLFRQMRLSPITSVLHPTLFVYARKVFMNKSEKQRMSTIQICSGCIWLQVDRLLNYPTNSKNCYLTLIYRHLQVLQAIWLSLTVDIDETQMTSQVVLVTSVTACCPLLTSATLPMSHHQLILARYSTSNTRYYKRWMSKLTLIYIHWQSFWHVTN